MRMTILKLQMKVFLLLLLIGCFSPHYAIGQALVIKKSTKIETIDGRKYYIHVVEKKQTLYSIAKVYGTTVDIVLSNNPEAIEGLKEGAKLKIPIINSSTSSQAVDVKKQNDIKQTEKKEIETKGVVKKQTEKKEQETKVLEQKESGKNLVTEKPKEHKPDAKERRSARKNAKSNTITVVEKPKSDSIISVEEYVKPIGDIHVAVFLPLSLNKVADIDVENIIQGNDELPPDVKAGIEFYEGVKFAVDSLGKNGYKGHLHIYDTNVDSAALVKLLKKPELSEMDLIIGPLKTKNFSLLLKFAKDREINIVSPIIQANNILLGNRKVSKVTPAYVTQSEHLGKFVGDRFHGSNIIAFNSANPRDRAYINTFKKAANLELEKNHTDTVKEMTLTTMDDFLNPSKLNVVAIPSTNQAFVAEAINKLFLHKQEKMDSVVIIGMSNWNEIESLDFSYLQALNAYVSTYDFIDYSNPNTKKFISKYRNLYLTEPTEYVYMGFDIGYFYLSGLQKYGNQLQKKLPELKQNGIRIEFNFFQADPNSGYENCGVGIFKFENYSYKRIQ